MQRSTISDDAFDAATEAGAAELQTLPRAVKARYDHRRRRLVVRLASGVELAFAPRDVEGLGHASPEQLREVEIAGAGFGLHWPALDADLHVPSLVEGLTGSPGWMAAARRPAA